VAALYGYLSQLGLDNEWRDLADWRSIGRVLWVALENREMQTASSYVNRNQMKNTRRRKNEAQTIVLFDFGHKTVNERMDVGGWTGKLDGAR
jgi:hypothetical protein